MLWFNAEKDRGALRTDDGERIEMTGAAFGTGELPVGRCAGKTIEFESVEGTVREIAFISEPTQRRARRRHRR